MELERLSLVPQFNTDSKYKRARIRQTKYNDAVVFEVAARDINMANCKEEGAKFCIKCHHRAKGIISQYLSNPGSSIIRQKKENNVGKVMNENSCQFVTLL